MESTLRELVNAMRSTTSTAMRRAVLLVAVNSCLLSLAAGCGGKDATAVRVAGHAITSGEVEHWISVLKARGGNGHEPGAPAPVPPHYAACIAFARAHRSAIPPSTPEIPKKPRAYCEFEYRRFKLKALYLLISYRWVSGEAAELGVQKNKPELARDLSYFRKALGLTSAAAYKRYLAFMRADTADLLLSFEMEQLRRAVEAKVTAAAKTTAQRERALSQFGKAFKSKWLARTDCRSGYVVPICRQYRPGRTPETFVPPAVPLTDETSGG
jgi:hypothetical protein